MGVKIMGGYDTATGWPADDSTGVQFENDVELPRWQGGGQGFGLGGFPNTSRLYGGTAGQQGTSLSSVPRGGGAPASGGLDIFGPQRQNLRPGMSPAVRTGPGPSTDATFPQTAPPLWMKLGTPFGLGAAAGGAAVAGIGNEADAVTGGQTQVDTHGYGPGQNAPAGAPPVAPGIVMNPETMWRAQHPDYPKSRLLDSPAGAAPYPQDYPVSRLLDSPAAQTGAAPPVVAHVPVARAGGGPRVTLPAAGPAAAVQQPNLGNYNPFTTIDRPNMSPQNSAYGHQGNVTGTALDLSRLFGGGAPAVATAPATATAPAKNTPYLDTRSRAPGTMGPLQKGSVWPREMGPKKRPKSSSSSQGGN